ncbi:hypothetical protein BaRGS_00012808 [Batillaria attramentaria]|uniref:Secreted protein n=1 Tax=Batillaria attramentaria TaxID=370345 RepID=A0ABD0L8W2_9CAEN
MKILCFVFLFLLPQTNSHRLLSHRSLSAKQFTGNWKTNTQTPRQREISTLEPFQRHNGQSARFANYTCDNPSNRNTDSALLQSQPLINQHARRPLKRREL